MTLDRLGPWFRLFRAVNLPTVPGDVLVGASAVLAGAAGGPAGSVRASATALLAAASASVAVYMFGLADNDIVGAKTDAGRPIPEGLISLRAARVARGLCFFAALVAGAAANLPPLWWGTVVALALAVVGYNRTKSCILMGLCRGLDVLAGGAVLLPLRPGAVPSASAWALAGAAAVFTAYVAGVTKYSEGEEGDPARRRRVGFLVGAIVYLQLAALMVFCVRPLLVAGAVLLVLLRFVKRLLPKVSAS